MANSTRGSNSNRNKNMTVVAGNDDDDDDEFLGSLISYTIGDFVVPRSWLQEQMEALGISDMMPRQMTDKSAFKAAAAYLLNGSNTETQKVGRRVEYDLKKGDKDTYHLIASMYTPEDGDQSGGTWDDETIGVFRYMRGDDVNYVRPIPKVEEGNLFYDDWQGFTTRFLELNEEMKESHTGGNIHNEIAKWRRGSPDIFRQRDGGAVYFVPKEHKGTVDALSELCSRMDQFKTRGADLELQVWPVVDAEQQREQVAKHAQKSLERQIEKVVETALDTAAENQLDAKDAVNTVEEALGESEDFAAKYNALLDIEMDLSQLLTQWEQDLKNEKKAEIVEEVKAKL